MEDRRHALKHRRVTPAEFQTLLSRSGFGVRDYMALTGRHFIQVDGFLNQTRQDYIPLPAEVLLLELAIACPDVVTMMVAVNNEYLENAAPRSAPVVVVHKKRRA